MAWRPSQAVRLRLDVGRGLLPSPGGEGSGDEAPECLTARTPIPHKGRGSPMRLLLANLTNKGRPTSSLPQHETSYYRRAINPLQLGARQS